MEDFITNILVGVRQWVNGKLEDITYVISSHINELTSRITTAETKLSGIDDGAEANVIETVKVDGTALTVTDKAVDINLATPLAGKVDKVTGKGLSTEDFTTAYMTKLDALPADAAANVIEAITVNGTAVTVTDKTAAITITPGSTITVDSNDKVLTLSNDVLSSTISLSHDSENHLIKLIGKDSTVISEFSTDDFIKDGMLDYAGLHVRKTESSVTTWTPSLPSGVTEPAEISDGTYLVLNWNTGASKTPTFINVTSLIDTYTAGTGLTLTNHEFSLNAATESTIGGVKPGAGMDVDASGVITVSYATAQTAGAVKVGTGLSIDNNGVLSATGTSVSYADKTTYGIVRIGDGISVADGVISIAYVSVQQVLDVLNAPESNS
jgi:hypothetical protein